MTSGRQPIGDRLNAEPVILRGYTDSELMAAVGGTTALCLPGGLVAGALAGSVTMGLGMGFLGGIGLVFLGSGMFQAWKRGRPEFWLEQRVHRVLAGAGLVRTPLARRRGCLSLGRAWYDDPERARRRTGRVGRRRS